MWVLSQVSGCVGENPLVVCQLTVPVPARKCTSPVVTDPGERPVGPTRYPVEMPVSPPSPMTPLPYTQRTSFDDVVVVSVPS